MPRFEWAGISSRSADDLVGSKPRGNAAREDAKAFLQRVLVDGEMPSQKVMDMAEDEGISARTLKRAKSDLGVVSRPSKEGWFWRLK